MLTLEPRVRLSSAPGCLQRAQPGGKVTYPSAFPFPFSTVCTLPPVPSSISAKATFLCARTERIQPLTSVMGERQEAVAPSLILGPDASCVRIVAGILGSFWRTRSVDRIVPIVVTVLLSC